MPQRLGEYRDRVIVQSRTETRDQAGEPIIGWSQFGVRWMKRRMLNGSERDTANVTRTAESTHEFRTHFVRGVESRMRLLYPGAVAKLAAAVTSATATALTVDSASGFPTRGSYRLRVASELMEVTAGQGTTAWTVTRGVDGTTAATAYATGQTVQHMQPFDVESTDVDWMHGAELVLRGRLSDGLA